MDIGRAAGPIDIPGDSLLSLDSPGVDDSLEDDPRMPSDDSASLAALSDLEGGVAMDTADAKNVNTGVIAHIDIKQNANVPPEELANWAPLLEQNSSDDLAEQITTQIQLIEDLGMVIQANRTKEDVIVEGRTPTFFIQSSTATACPEGHHAVASEVACQAAAAALGKNFSGRGSWSSHMSNCVSGGISSSGTSSNVFFNTGGSLTSPLGFAVCM